MKTVKRRRAAFARPGSGLLPGAARPLQQHQIVETPGIMARGTELPGLLRECGLGEKLLALQVLDAVLHLGNLGFVDFEGCLYGCGGRGCFGGCRRLLAPGQPHDGDHEKRQSDEKPRLDVLWQKALRFRRFFLNLRGWVGWLIVGPSVPGRAARNGSFFVPMAR